MPSANRGSDQLGLRLLNNAAKGLRFERHFFLQSMPGLNELVSLITE